MKRHIIFRACGGKNWIGGVYYLQNIIFMLSQNQKIKESFVIDVIGDDECRESWIVSDLDISICIRFFKNNTIRKIYCLTKFIYGRAVAYNCLFNCSTLFVRMHVNWIADFQHNHYPQYFEEIELNQRDERNSQIAKSKGPLVLSSQDAKRDFENFYCAESQNVYVVPFVSYIEPQIRRMNPCNIQEIIRKYNLESRKYVFIANQFWQHKNHKVIFEMLAVAKSECKLQNIKFVFTGELKDYRIPEYLVHLQAIIHDNDLDDQIQILGFIDRFEQLVLMRESLLLIQPSLFEGWGTVVEDGKVLDKTMVLSDIQVHHEQMNSKCTLFNPFDPYDLLDVLEKNIANIQNDSIEDGILDMYARAKEYSKGLEKLLLNEE